MKVLSFNGKVLSMGGKVLAFGVTASPPPATEVTRPSRPRAAAKTGDTNAPQRSRRVYQPPTS